MKKYSEFFTIPIAFIVFFVFNAIGEQLGWHLYGVEVIQKLFIGLILFLVVLGVGRLIFKISFPALYNYVDDDLNTKNPWNALTETQKTVAGICLFVSFLLCFTLLVSGV